MLAAPGKVERTAFCLTGIATPLPMLYVIILTCTTGRGGVRGKVVSGGAAAGTNGLAQITQQRLI
jgi:hypothetical protein